MNPINRISKYYKSPDARLARPEKATSTRRERSRDASARNLEAWCIGLVVLMGAVAASYLIGATFGAGFRLGLGL